MHICVCVCIYIYIYILCNFSVHHKENFPAHPTQKHQKKKVPEDFIDRARGLFCQINRSLFAIKKEKMREKEKKSTVSEHVAEDEALPIARVSFGLQKNKK